MVLYTVGKRKKHYALEGNSFMYDGSLPSLERRDSHCTRFRLRSSFITSSSSIVSAVSAGFRSEWTFEAMLDRRVCEAELSVALDPNFEPPPNDHALSALVVEAVVSLVKGGVVWREPEEGRISYCANTSRTCCELSTLIGTRRGDGGHWPEPPDPNCGCGPPCHPWDRISADV